MLTDFGLQPNCHTHPWSAVWWSPPRNQCNCMNYYSSTDAEGWKADMAWLADP